MSSDVKLKDRRKKVSRNAWWLALAGVLAINTVVSYGIVRLNAPVTVAFNMKQTVDAFFDSASQKQLSEAQSKTLSARFNTALEASLQAWQQKHHAVILVSPAVVQGAPDTRVLSDNESKVFFEKVKGQYPEMDIKIPFLTVMETLQYKPAESAAKVQCPVLVVIAGQDSVNPPEQGRALYDAVASGTKELYEEADACHYDIYEGAFFERVAAVQTQWFKKHL